MIEKRPPWLTPQLVEYWAMPDAVVLRATLVGEAEGEGSTGMFGVACVLRNRLLLNWLHAESYRQLCLQPHQFSCWWNSFKARERSIRAAVTDPIRYCIAEKAARDCIEGAPDITGGATHYFAYDVVIPWWANSLVRFCRIGNHDFYGMESP